MTSPTDLANEVITRARESADSDAACDYTIAVDGIGGPPFHGLFNEVYVLANEHLPEIVEGSGEDELDLRMENGTLLWEQLLPELAEYEQQCKSRKYLGWSNASGGPIRYADSD